jgi:hypothetical protein
MGRVHQFRGPRRRRHHSGRDIKYIAQLVVFSALTGLAVFKGPENLPFVRDIPEFQLPSSSDWTDFTIVDDRSDTASDSGSCDIKGNIAFETGERIYHVPGQMFYDSTFVNPGKGEQWFCSEKEARAAGWRRSKR